MSLITEALGALNAAFDAFDPPYCSGTVPLDETTSTVFYRSGNKAEFIDFSKLNTMGIGLISLVKACQPASFGRNKEDIIDETYRKAGKLDPTHFSTLFSPLSSGVIDTIRENLLRGQNVDRAIRVELYKLNVYGPGEFFKAHVDTPRSDTMFGSLVVILPTAHQGGSLIFRHQGKEQILDTANLVSLQPAPHAAFVAFFSDVEHEVAVVTSGYRVTLTYNLYFIDRDKPQPSQITMSPVVSPDDQTSLKIKSGLSTILANDLFLPKGGLVGFGLSHKYPIKLEGKITKLSDLEGSLKGGDAIIQNICRQLSLDASLYALYTPISSQDNVSVLLNELTNYSELTSSQLSDDTDILQYLKCEYGGEYIYDYADGHPKVSDIEWLHDAEDLKNATPIVWVKPLTDFNTFKAPFIEYFGNSPGLSHSYGSICLIARVGRPEDRLDFKH